MAPVASANANLVYSFSSEKVRASCFYKGEKKLIRQNESAFWSANEATGRQT